MSSGTEQSRWGCTKPTARVVVTGVKEPSKTIQNVSKYRSFLQLARSQRSSSGGRTGIPGGRCQIDEILDNGPAMSQKAFELALS